MYTQLGSGSLKYLKSIPKVLPLPRQFQPLPSWVARYYKYVLEEKDVVRVNGADGLLDALIERYDAHVLLVSGLVEWIVPRDPGVGLVVFGKCFPELDGAVLEVFVYPDCGSGGGDLDEGGGGSGVMQGVQAVQAVPPASPLAGGQALT